MTITLVTHDSFAVSKPVLAAFTAQTGVKVKVLKSGDAGAALNQAILTKDEPLGDVLFGVDNTFLSRALDAGIFAPYAPTALRRCRPSSSSTRRTSSRPVDYGDVCVNYDKQWFAAKKLAVPKTLDDLTKPAYKGQLVVENPATSSPGLAFLLATIAKFGDDGWQDYWAKLRANDVKVVDGWERRTTATSPGADQGNVPARRVVRVEPAGRGVLLEAAADDLTDRDAARLVLPAGGVRRRAAGQPSTRRRRATRRLHAVGAVPGRHAAADVRVPRARRHAAAGGVHQVRRGADPTR